MHKNWSDHVHLDLSFHAASFIFLYSALFVSGSPAKDPGSTSQLSFPFLRQTWDAGAVTYHKKKKDERHKHNGKIYT